MSQRAPTTEQSGKLLSDSIPTVVRLSESAARAGLSVTTDSTEPACRAE